MFGNFLGFLEKCSFLGKTAVANFLQLCENGLLYIATSGHTAAVTFKNKIFVWIWNSAAGTILRIGRSSRFSDELKQFFFNR